MRSEQEGAVSIAEKPETVVQGIVVNTAPGISREGGNEKKQRASRLMEIGNNSVSSPENVTGHYNNTG